MSKYTFKKQNSHKGIKIASYEKELEALKEYETRGKKEIETLNKSIIDESSHIEQLVNAKQEALYSGDQETFMKLSEELRTVKDSMEYYIKRKESLKNSSDLKKDELIKFSKQLRSEQDRLNGDALKWLYEELDETISVLAEVEKELNEGDSILFNAIKLYRSNTSEEEFQETIKGVPGFDNLTKKVVYPDLSISRLLEKMRGHVAYLEQPSMKKWIEER